MKNRISYLIIRVDKDRVSVALSKVLVKTLATLQGSRRALQGTNRSILPDTFIIRGDAIKCYV